MLKSWYKFPVEYYRIFINFLGLVTGQQSIIFFSYFLYHFMRLILQPFKKYGHLLFTGFQIFIFTQQIYLLIYQLILGPANYTPCLPDFLLLVTLKLLRVSDTCSGYKLLFGIRVILDIFHAITKTYLPYVIQQHDLYRLYY